MDLLEDDQHSIQVTEAFSVRPIEKGDVAGLALLWAEMQRHYAKPVTDDVALHAASIACNVKRNEGFEPRILVAVADGNSIVGSIVLNVSFPANELTRSLYIRDLYVAAAIRRRGVARALLRAAAALALSQGFSALDWTTEAGNASARRLYEGEGARQLPRVYYRLDTSDLRRIADS